MKDKDWQSEINRLKARERKARQILGVSERASLDEIKRAWREKSLTYHPDHNRDNPSAHKQFILVNCAYKFLLEGTGCDELDEQDTLTKEKLSINGKYRIDNAWGYFAWWRENYFSEDNKTEDKKGISAMSNENYSKKQIMEKTLAYLDRAGIILTDKEKQNIEIADLGLNDIKHIGLEIITYVNTQRCCAKEIVLFEWQICPEHRHPPFDDNPGKEETFRCRWGQVYLYVPGKPVSSPKAKIPDKYKQYFTVWHEIVLNPGEQYTLEPNTLHWFQAGPQGAVISEFSTQSRDELDIFTNPNIKRI